MNWIKPGKFAKFITLFFMFTVPVCEAISTASGGASTYGNEGRIGVTLADVFLPMKASALHAGMTYLPPLVFQGASNDKLPQYQRQLIERLKM